ncbi:hypothetical protein [Sphingomonas montana]|uniref:hypothetical protein n=1 Tax=Sphingomonas montana TaxID=1843236 RepID=UPI00096CDF99|nr:hypothetical protein [Sphingomonas montana]
MKPARSLAGKRILILEDDFYLAREAATVLAQAGAAVVGPFGTAFRPGDLAGLTAVDGAVVDINLGRGPAFDVACLLTERGVPFLFVTGYDAAIIPADLAHVERLEKPIRPAELVAAVLRLAPAT